MVELRAVCAGVRPGSGFFSFGEVSVGEEMWENGNIDKKVLAQLLRHWQLFPHYSEKFVTLFPVNIYLFLAIPLKEESMFHSVSCHQI